MAYFYFLKTVRLRLTTVSRRKQRKLKLAAQCLYRYENFIQIDCENTVLNAWIQNLAMKLIENVIFNIHYYIRVGFIRDIPSHEKIPIKNPRAKKFRVPEIFKKSRGFSGDPEKSRFVKNFKIKDPRYDTKRSYQL